MVGSALMLIANSYLAINPSPVTNFIQDVSDTTSLRNEIRDSLKANGFEFPISKSDYRKEANKILIALSLSSALERYFPKSLFNFTLGDLPRLSLQPILPVPSGIAGTDDEALDKFLAIARENKALSERLNLKLLLGEVFKNQLSVEPSAYSGLSIGGELRQIPFAIASLRKRVARLENQQQLVAAIESLAGIAVSSQPDATPETPAASRDILAEDLEPTNRRAIASKNFELLYNRIRSYVIEKYKDIRWAPEPFNSKLPICFLRGEGKVLTKKEEFDSKCYLRISWRQVSRSMVTIDSSSQLTFKGSLVLVASIDPIIVSTISSWLTSPTNNGGL